MLFMLIASHCLMDFALQGDAMATCKCRRANHPLQKAVPWYYWMLCHCILQGAGVTVVIWWFGYGWTAAVWLGVAETVIHFFADIAKCEKLTNIHIDQAIHIACKVAWWAILTYHFAWLTSVLPPV